MSQNITSLFGGPTGSPKVVPQCVEVLERWLEMARAGEVVGVVIAGLHHDRCGSFSMAGMVGGYSMLGALDEAHAHVLDVVRGD